MTSTRSKSSKTNGPSRQRQKYQSVRSGERFARVALLVFPVLLPVVLFTYFYHPSPTLSVQLSAANRPQQRLTRRLDHGGTARASATSPAAADIYDRDLHNFVDPDFFSIHPTLESFLVRYPLPRHGPTKDVREFEAFPDDTPFKGGRDGSSGIPPEVSPTAAHHPPTMCIVLPSSPRPFRASTKKKPWHLVEQVLRSLNDRLSNSSIFNASNMRIVVYSSGCATNMGTTQASSWAANAWQQLTPIIGGISQQTHRNRSGSVSEMDPEEIARKRAVPRWIRNLSARDRQWRAEESRHTQQQQQEQHGDSGFSPDTNSPARRRLLAKTDNSKLPPDMQFDRWTDEERARFVSEHTERLKAVAAGLAIPTVVLPPRQDACAVVDPHGSIAPSLVPTSFSGTQRASKWGWQAKLALDFIYAARQCALTRPDLVLTLQDDVEPVHAWDFGVQEFMRVDLPAEGKAGWSMLSLYAPRSYGWRIKHGQEYALPCCAQALLFNASSGALDDLLGRMEGTFSLAPMDHQVRDWLEGAGRKAYVHAPSLFQHVGMVRTKTVGVDASAYHHDPTFQPHLLRARKRGERAIWALFDPTARARAVNQVLTHG